MQRAAQPPPCCAPPLRRAACGARRLRAAARRRSNAAALPRCVAAQQRVHGSTNAEVHAQLAERALALARRAGEGGRVLIGLAGSPGSGKSTTSTEVVRLLNAAGAAGAPPLAAVLPMDGFHLYRAQLDRMPDPAAAHARRGAHWTFDAAAFVACVRAAAEPGAALAVPGFDHAVGDPEPGALRVEGGTRVVIVEGNYLYLPLPPWRELQPLLSERWVDEAMGRIVRRHMAANGDSEERARARVAGNDRLNGEEVWATRGVADVLVPSLPWDA